MNTERGLAVLEYLVISAAVFGAIVLLLNTQVSGTTTAMEQATQGVMDNVADEMTYTNLGDGRTADVLLQ